MTELENDDVVKTDNDVFEELRLFYNELVHKVKDVEDRIILTCKFKKGDFVKFPIRKDKMAMGTVESISINDKDGRLYVRIKERNSTHWMTIGDRTIFYYDEFNELELLDKDVVINDRITSQNLVREIDSVTHNMDLSQREIESKRKELFTLLDEARNHCVHDMIDTNEPHNRTGEQTIWKCKFCDKYGGV